MRRLIVTAMVLIGIAIAVVVMRSPGCLTATSHDGRGDGSAGLKPAHVFAPPVPARGAVVLFSDRQGWDGAMDAAAQAIAEAGEMVVGFDTPQVLAGAIRTPAGCLDLSAAVADAAARALGAAEYETEGLEQLPVLVGTGDGATLAYAVLAQSPQDRFAGVVPISFTGEMASAAPLCPGAAAEPAGSGVLHYQPAAMLPGWLALVSDHPDASTVAAYAAAAGAEVISVQGNFDLAASVITALAQQRNENLQAGAGGIADLPVVPLPVEHRAALMAIIYSGDGGWRDADKRIGEALQASGVPVVGVDSLRYFWREKTPEQMAADLETILAHYRQLWGASQVLLIGYSFGADILPFAVNRLAPEARAQIAQISLLGLANRADFAIQVTGWLGADPSEQARPVLPEIAHLDRAKLQCFHGEEEDHSACTEPALDGAEIIAMPGGHHFDGKYAEIAQRIIAGARRRLTGAGLSAKTFTSR